MRKLFGFVVGSLSALFLFFAYTQLADAGNEKGGGGKNGQSSEDPCTRYIREAKKLKNPDFKGGRILECETKERYQTEEDECTQAYADRVCAKRVKGSDYIVDDATATYNGKSGMCTVVCDIRQKKPNEVIPTPTSTPVPSEPTPTQASQGPTPNPDPQVEVEPTKAPVAVEVTIEPKPTSAPANSTPTPVPTNTPDPVVEKTCSEDEIVAELRRIILDDHSDILEKQFVLTYSKVAYRTLKQTNSRQLKTVENLIVAQSKELDKLNAADGGKVTKAIQELYAKMGRSMDEAQVIDLINKMKSKNNYEMKTKRADNMDVSAYIIASRTLEKDPDNKALAYKDIDSAILWYQDVLATTLEEGIRRGKRGAASSNLQYASVRLAHMMGYVSKKTPNEKDLVSRIEKDSAELRAIMDKAEEKLIAWYKTHCQKQECVDCATNRINDSEKDNRWLKAIKGIIDEMGKDPELRKKKSTEGGKIVKPDKWKDDVKLTIINPTEPVAKPMNQSGNKPMNQSGNDEKNNSDATEKTVPKVTAETVDNNCAAIEKTDQSCIKSEIVAPTPIPVQKNEPITTEPSKVLEPVVNDNGSAPVKKTVDPVKNVEESLKSLTQFRECDASTSVSIDKSSNQVIVNVNLSRNGNPVGHPVVVSLTQVESSDAAKARERVDQAVESAMNHVSMIKGGLDQGCGM